MKDLIQIFRALADETRLKMLALVLKHGELCVCDFVKVLQITQSKASRHLRYLTHAGFLTDRREAVWIHYRITDHLAEAQRTILNSLPQMLGQAEVDELERKFCAWIKRKNCGVSQTKLAAAELSEAENE